MNNYFILFHKKDKKWKPWREDAILIDNKESTLDHRLYSEWAGIQSINDSFDNIENLIKENKLKPGDLPEFVTIAHYRRQPDPDCIKRIYVAQPMVFQCSLAQQYAGMHFIEDLKYLGEAIKQKFPHMAQFSEMVLNQNILIPYNIVTCPYGQFRDYSKFVLEVLKTAHQLAGNHNYEETLEIFKRREVPKFEGRDNRPEYQARWLSFISERASTIYWKFCSQNVPVFPCRINLLEEGQKI